MGQTMRRRLAVFYGTSLSLLPITFEYYLNIGSRSLFFTSLVMVAKRTGSCFLLPSCVTIAACSKQIYICLAITTDGTDGRALAV